MVASLPGTRLGAKAYFAHQYSSWERGLNENFNGLLRQYIPKGTDLQTVTDEEIAQAQRALNLRPRKCLEFRQHRRVSHFEVEFAPNLHSINTLHPNILIINKFWLNLCFEIST